jgi:hypothetical protein
LKSDELNTTLQQNSVLLDEWSNHPVDQDGRACARPLRATHGDSFVPKGAAFPKLNSFGGIVDAFLPKVVFLDEEDLRGVGSEANQALTSFNLTSRPSGP